LCFALPLYVRFFCVGALPFSRARILHFLTIWVFFLLPPTAGLLFPQPSRGFPNFPYCPFTQFYRPLCSRVLLPPCPETSAVSSFWLVCCPTGLPSFLHPVTPAFRDDLDLPLPRSELFWHYRCAVPVLFLLPRSALLSQKAALDGFL